MGSYQNVTPDFTFIFELINLMPKSIDVYEETLASLASYRQNFPTYHWDRITCIFKKVCNEVYFIDFLKKKRSYPKMTKIKQHNPECSSLPFQNLQASRY